MIRRSLLLLALLPAVVACSSAVVEPGRVSRLGSDGDAVADERPSVVLAQPAPVQDRAPDRRAGRR